MRRALLWLSIVCFGVALIMSWYFSITLGIIATFVLGALMVFSGYLMMNDPKVWISILMFVISLCLVIWGTANLASQSASSVESQTGIVTESQCETCHPAGVHIEIAE